MQLILYKSIDTSFDKICFDTTHTRRLKRETTKPKLVEEGTRKYRSYIANRNTNSYGDDSLYYEFLVGNSAFFVLDTRSYRSNNNMTDGKDKTMIGTKQKERLFSWLLKSQSSNFPFKFIYFYSI